MAKNKQLTKEIEKYLNLPYTFELIKEDSGIYFVKVKELPGCMSNGKTADEAMENIKDVMEIWLESSLRRGLEIPLPEVMREYSGRFIVRVPASLHKKLALEAKKEGVSLNQYVVSILSEGASVKDIESLIKKIMLESSSKNLIEKSLKKESITTEWRGEEWKKTPTFTTTSLKD